MSRFFRTFAILLLRTNPKGMGDFIYISWFVTLLSFLAISFATSKTKALLAIIAVIFNASLMSWLAFPALGGHAVSFSIAGGNFLGEVPVRIDGLSAWFILIINFTSVMGVIYGKGYLEAYRSTPAKLNLHWILYILFHLSMLWVCMLQQAFVFLIAWEVMSLTSMLLVIFDYHKSQTLKAGINYLVQMHVSIVLLTIGFIWVYRETGSFDFDAIRLYFSGNPNTWLFLVFFLGFGLKAGFIPLHSWLPHAHPAAPSHISGVMSGVIVKLGIYGILRIITYLQQDFLLLGELLVSLSIMTGLYGILNAAVYRDFKRMLAYCTIENIGIIGIGLGLGLIGIANGSAALYYLGFGGALLHVLNHSLFKSLLFFAAGSVYRQTHTRDIEHLGGLVKSMPKTAALFLIGALAIGGIPPFNGFISEFIIYCGLIAGLSTGAFSQAFLLALTLSGMALIGGLSILTFTKVFGTIFLGNARKTIEPKPTEVPFLMLLPQYLIVSLMLMIAFFPGIFLRQINTILGSFTQHIFALQPASFETMAQFPFADTISRISLYSALFIGFALVVWILRSFSPRPASVQHPTWGCGYVAPNNRMQYTGKSFSKPLSKAFNFLMIEQKQYGELKADEIFPFAHKYKSSYHDFFELRLIDPIVRRIVWATKYFSFIQNGRIQSYVIYGILFIVVIFFITVLNLMQ